MRGPVGLPLGLVGPLRGPLMVRGAAPVPEPAGLRLPEAASRGAEGLAGLRRAVAAVGLSVALSAVFAVANRRGLLGRSSSRSVTRDEWVTRRVGASSLPLTRGLVVRSASRPVREDGAARRVGASSLLRVLVGVELRVQRIEAKFKLGQNRSAEDRAGLAEGLAAAGDPASAALLALMRESGC